MMIRMRAIWACPAAIMVMAGCAGQPHTTASSQPDSPNHQSRQTAWPYWPASMRIHPLTRFAHDEQSDESIIEARIEFTDADSVTTRAVGRLTLTLLAPEAEADESPIRQWQDIDLSDRTINMQRFDKVTRTYLLKLQVDPSKLPARCALKAAFESNDGQVFSATRTVQKPARKSE